MWSCHRTKFNEYGNYSTLLYLTCSQIINLCNEAIFLRLSEYFEDENGKLFNITKCYIIPCLINSKNLIWNGCTVKLSCLMLSHFHHPVVWTTSTFNIEGKMSVFKSLGLKKNGTRSIDKWIDNIISFNL